MEIKKQRSRNICLKVTIVGPSDSGKSSIVNQFISRVFKDEMYKTIGGAWSKKSIPIHNDAVRLDIWDTSGDMKYKTLTRMYYENSNFILIVFDKTCLNSFKSIERYLKEARKHCMDYTKYAIVGNKNDLIPKVSFEKGQEMAKKLNCFYFDVNSKNYESLEFMFTIMGNACI